MADAERLKKQMLSILSENVINLIEFRIPQTGIHPSYLKVVKSHLAEGRLEVETIPSGTKLMHYDKDDDKFLLISTPLDNNTFHRATILHEAVHAAMDLAKAKCKIIDTESVAYISDSIYVRANQTNNERPSRLKSDIEKAAWDLACKVFEHNSSDQKRPLCLDVVDWVHTPFPGHFGRVISVNRKN